MTDINYSKRKVIFLDIDGVLATERTQQIEKRKWYNEKAYPFEPKSIKSLNQILEKVDTDIVLTSDWRRVFSLVEIDKVFKFNKLEQSPNDYSKVLHNRDKEIRDYVKENKLSKFVIIDDMQLNVYKERFIRTQAEKGLQLYQVKKIVKLLK